MRSIFSLFLVLLSGPVFCQTGPGGVGSNDGSSNLQLWLDANRGPSSSVDGTNLSSWNDQSGNGVNVLQGTVANQPSFESDATNAINGYPVIHFDGNDQLQTINSLNIVNDHSIFLVKEDNTTQPTSNSAYLTIIGTSAGLRIYRGDGINDKYLTKATGGTTTDYISTSGVTNNAPYIGEYARTGTSLFLSRFGGTYITDNGSAGPLQFGTNPTLSVGSFNNALYLQGNIAEKIVFNRKVNSAEKIIIENYLSAKYGVTLSANDIYNEDIAGNGNYDHDVAGIGRVNSTNLHDDAQGTGIIRILNPSGLGDNEFLIWGHDNGILDGIETTDVPVGIPARFDRVWRASEANSSGASVDVGTIDIRFDLTGLGTVTSSDLRLLVDSDNDGVFSDETPISGATSIGGNVYEFSGITAITDNRRFTLATSNSTQTPLPIELTQFDAALLEDETVKITWQTVSESNNDYFTLERSGDGSNWQKLYRIDGAGNSSSLLYYDAIDIDPLLGTSYYRLVQTDFDGESDISQIRSVHRRNTDDLPIEIYPNPVEKELTINGSTDELESIRICHTIGARCNINNGSY